MIRTTAAVVHAIDEPFRLESVELTEPRDDELVVRMVAAGLCHTDLSVRAGLTPFPLPGVLGHEGAGVVEAVGSRVRQVRPGDHVLLSFSSCGDCPSCHRGHPATCDHWQDHNLLGGSRPDGTHTVHHDGASLHGHFFGQSSFAQHALVEERSVVKVDRELPLDLLAPLGCGIQTGVGTVLNVLRPERATALMIFGAGAVGLAALMAAVTLGVNTVIMVDRLPERLQLARELGATAVIDTGVADAVTAAHEFTGGRGVDATVEATGSPQVLDQAVRALASGGTCAIVGAPRMGTTLPVDIKFLMRGRRLIGVTQGDSDPQRFLPVVVDLVVRGRLPLEQIIRRYPFRDIEKAANDAASGETIKPVLLFGLS